MKLLRIYPKGYFSSFPSRVGGEGFEPSTFGLSDQRSNLLSYPPIYAGPNSRWQGDFPWSSQTFRIWCGTWYLSTARV